MIHFIKQKLLHKKWMVVSLLIGNILLIAIACSNPMYQGAALQKTLSSKLDEYIQEENQNPGVISFEANMKGQDGQDRKSTRLNSSHSGQSRMPSSA